MIARIFARIAFGIVVFLCVARPVDAHVEGVTDTMVEIKQSGIALEYTVPLVDLEAMGDKAGLPYEELISTGFGIANEETACVLTSFSQQPLENIGSQQYFLDFDCDSDIQTLSIEYKLIPYLDASHNNFTRVTLQRGTKNFVLSAHSPRIEIPVAYILYYWSTLSSANESGLESQTASATDAESIAMAEDFEDGFMDSGHYFPVGFSHILKGYDHVLFLIGLLLLPFGFRSLILLATSFTLAHSITLALSVFDYLSLPVAPVEIAIACSIVYVAVENLWEIHKKTHTGLITLNSPASPLRRRLVITFLFGLVHGFGFSYLLREIGLGDQALGALLFFNLGVEAGQILIITLAFPALYYVFKQDRRMIFARIGSVLVGCMGGLWAVERIYATFW